MRDLCFIDVETTGLDSDCHEIIEIAAVRVDGRYLDRCVGAVHLRVQPRRIWTASSEALRLNGYTPEGWADAATFADALREFDELLAGAMPAGHNVAFDLAFVRAAHASIGFACPETSHLALDTASLAYPLLARGEVESLRLDALLAHCRIRRHGRAHTAWSDVQATRDLARHLLGLDGCDDMEVTS